MKKLIQFLISRFREAMTYYIWGGLILIILMLDKLTLNNIEFPLFLIFLGVVVMLTGILIDLGKHRVDSIQNTNIEKAIVNIKSNYLKNVIRNVSIFYNNYRSRDMYMCKFCRKTGTIMVIFVESLDTAKDYMNWYLDTENTTCKSIDIGKNKVTNIQACDVEDFEYKKVSWLQHHFINPILAFFKQPSFSFISLKKIIIFSILTICSVTAYFYIDENYSFIGKGSLDTLGNIFVSSVRIIEFVLFFSAITTLIAGVFSFGKAIQNYYTDTLAIKRSVLSQLLTLFFAAICFNIFIHQCTGTIIQIVQSNGLFLP